MKAHFVAAASSQGEAHDFVVNPASVSMVKQAGSRAPDGKNYIFNVLGLDGRTLLCSLKAESVQAAARMVGFELRE